MLKIGLIFLLSITLSAKPFKHYKIPSIMKISWYNPNGCKTASGQVFRPYKAIIAHRYLPFGTKLKLRYENKQVIGIVLDRGPYIKGIGLDVSPIMAKRLGIIKKGVVKVKVSRVRG
jgi:rare lipoprotein A